MQLAALVEKLRVRLVNYEEQLVSISTFVELRGEREGH